MPDISREYSVLSLRKSGLFPSSGEDSIELRCCIALLALWLPIATPARSPLSIRERERPTHARLTPIHLSSKVQRSMRRISRSVAPHLRRCPSSTMNPSARVSMISTHLSASSGTTTSSSLISPSSTTQRRQLSTTESRKMSFQPEHPTLLIPGPIEFDDAVLQSMSHFRYVPVS